jgi:hypothetical protein
VTRHLHRHSFRYSSPHKVPDGAFPYAQALADLARCAAGRFQPRRLFREMVETRATPHGLDGESTRPAAQKIPVLPDKELMMASSIGHILTFFVRTVSVIAIIWLAFLAAKIVSQRFAWPFLHRFLRPPF